MNRPFGLDARGKLRFRNSKKNPIITRCGTLQVKGDVTSHKNTLIGMLKSIDEHGFAHIELK